MPCFHIRFLQIRFLQTCMTNQIKWFALFAAIIRGNYKNSQRNGNEADEF